MPKKRTKKEERKDQQTVVLEEMNSKFDLMMEVHQETNKKLDCFIAETNENFERIEGKLLEHDQKFDTIFDILFRVEGEVAKLREEVSEIKNERSVDIARIEKIEARLTQIEISLEKNKIAA